VFALPEADFVEELRSLTGTDPAILENRDLLRLFLPTLRADFEMADTYACRHSGTLPLPIFAYGGEHDDEIPREDLDAWALETDRPLVVRVYPGQHFFIRAEDRRVLDDVAHDLLGVLSPVEAGVPGGHGG
jgi:medium-chain acyl-[acyl-carrier-protein] hydrolase